MAITPYATPVSSTALRCTSQRRFQPDDARAQVTFLEGNASSIIRTVSDGYGRHSDWSNVDVQQYTEADVWYGTIEDVAGGSRVVIAIVQH